jgi:hypothetical protein
VYKDDPNGATLAFADMMRKQIVMPAHLMDDGQHAGKNKRNLFAVSVCGAACCCSILGLAQHVAGGACCARPDACIALC